MNSVEVDLQSVIVLEFFEAEGTKGGTQVHLGCRGLPVAPHVNFPGDVANLNVANRAGIHCNKTFLNPLIWSCLFGLIFLRVQLIQCSKMMCFKIFLKILGLLPSLG
jgi:hypothetical protein